MAWKGTGPACTLQALKEHVRYTGAQVALRVGSELAMSNLATLSLALGLALSLPSVALDDDAPPAEPASLRVMSFNIRYGTARDGDHVWPLRRELVEQRIADFAPDVLALQEALAFQLEQLESVLEGYVQVGQHREGGTGGEFSGLYVRQELELLERGEFWFSETPGEPGSKSWDSSLPRMAAWVDVRTSEQAPALRIYGTHYDHRGREARRRASEMILEHAADSERVIVMGDLNAREVDEPVALFLEAGYRSAVLEHEPETERGTFNGFRDEEGGGRRIDHVLVRGPLNVTEAAILGGRLGELFPSDHDAVVAVLGWGAEEPR